MKATKLTGIIALIIALCIMATGVVGSALRTGDSALALRLRDAQALQATFTTHAKSNEKTAPSALKKADAAVTASEKSTTALDKALSAAAALDADVANKTLDDDVISALWAAGAQEQADKMVLDLYAGYYGDALSAVNSAETKLITAVDGINAAYSESGSDKSLLKAEKTAKVTCKTPAEYNAALASLSQRMQDVSALCAESVTAAQDAAAVAASVCKQDSMPMFDRFLLLISGSYIGVLFTGFVVLLAALVLLFAAQKFAYCWKKYPIFSTFMALLALMVIQIYALGFQFDSIISWLDYWMRNMLNVLRSNSSAGMISLGMTLVIITGGIDLAVGSTLAGVATIVMVVLDVSSSGFFTAAGITGWPNFLLAIAAGLLAGVGIGTLIGLGVTKGRIPPFIITPGVMNIVRSVAQYFTKSYKPEVPKAFQVIANTEFGGHMLLPIIYWLVLAVIVYIISKHTAFGRHIYAVGSNERTSRLSGINVNRVKMKVYMLMGLIVAVAAITQVARLRGVDVSSAGAGYEMNAIAAVVVGGTSMAGGRGSIAGTMLGVLIIGIMNNLLVLLGIDAFLADAFTGAIIIAAVLMQRKDK